MSMSPPASRTSSRIVTIGLTVVVGLVALIGLTTVAVTLSLAFGWVGLVAIGVAISALAVVAACAVRNRHP